MTERSEGRALHVSERQRATCDGVWGRSPHEKEAHA